MSQVIAVTKKGCPACIETKPALVKAAIPQVDVDAHPSVVRKYEVQAFPDVIYRSRDGRVEHMPWNDGPPTKTALIDWVAEARSGKKSQKSKNDCRECQVNDRKEWGPLLWFVIHMTALMYPRHPTLAQRRKMMAFFSGLRDVLPCAECRVHFGEGLRKTDPRVFDSRDALFDWTVTFHQSVSDRTGSKMPPRSVDYWRQYYKGLAQMGAHLKRLKKPQKQR